MSVFDGLDDKTRAKIARDVADAPAPSPAQLDMLRVHLGPAVERALAERVRAKKKTRTTHKRKAA